MKKENERIAIDLPNGLKLVAEQNQDPDFPNEIFVGIENGDGVWLQDLATMGTLLLKICHTKFKQSFREKL